MKRSPNLRAGRPAGQPSEQAATRHLCAGAYVDPAFRDMVIRRVHNDASHRVAASYGFDLVAVVQHARRAWALDAAQQGCLLAVIITAVVLSRPAAVIAACAVGAWSLAGRALKNAPELAALLARSAAARKMRRPLAGGEAGRLRELKRLVQVSAGGSGLLAVIAIAAANAVPAGGARTAATAAVLLFLAAGAVAGTRAAGQIAVNRLHRASSLRLARQTRRAAMIDDQQGCDYVVYRRLPPEPGRHDTPGEWYQPVPFTGAGTLVHRWLPPLGIQLLRPGEGPMEDLEHASPPFQAHELVGHLMTAMLPIGQADDPARMRGFHVRHRLFIAEEDITGDRGFLQGPREPEEIDAIIDDPHSTSQHFLEMRVSAAGEVVTTAFLRVTVRGRTLSLDFTTCALTRTPDRYGTLDQFGENGKGAVIRAVLRGIQDVPAAISGLWRAWEIPWTLAGAWRARKDRTIIPRRGKRIGTQVSVREHAASPWAESGHDQVSIYDEMKIIEKRILRATQDFLETRDVDTAMFKRLTLSIVNSGFLNMGRLDARGAFGQGAQYHEHQREQGDHEGAVAGPQGE